MFFRVGAAQVAVTYKDTGLGFAFQPDGPSRQSLFDCKICHFIFSFCPAYRDLQTFRFPPKQHRNWRRSFFEWLMNL